MNSTMEDILTHLMVSDDQQAIDLLFNIIVELTGEDAVTRCASLHNISFSTIKHLIGTHSISASLIESLVLAGLLDSAVISELIESGDLDLNCIPINHLSKCKNIYKWILSHEGTRLLAELSIVCDKYHEAPPDWYINSHMYSFIAAFGEKSDVIGLLNDIGTYSLISPLSMRANDSIHTTSEIIKHMEKILRDGGRGVDLLVCHALDHANSKLLDSLLGLEFIKSKHRIGYYGYLYNTELTDKKIKSMCWLMQHDIFPDKNDFPLNVLPMLDLDTSHIYLDKAGIDERLKILILGLLRQGPVMNTITAKTAGYYTAWTSRPSQVLLLICQSCAGVTMAKTLINITGSVCRVNYENALYAACGTSDREMIMYLDQLAISDNGLKNEYAAALELLLCNDNATALWAYHRYAPDIDLRSEHYREMIRYGHTDILIMEIIKGNLYMIESLCFIETSFTKVYRLLSCLIPLLAVYDIRDFKELTTKRRLGRRPEHLSRESREIGHAHLRPAPQKIILKLI